MHRHPQREAAAQHCGAGRMSVRQRDVAAAVKGAVAAVSYTHLFGLHPHAAFA